MLFDSSQFPPVLLQPARRARSMMAGLAGLQSQTRLDFTHDAFSGRVA
tara:strand:- start:7596 stop:7739 length:144 start_codon:yes stop_codon:yes gene_type:complete